MEKREPTDYERHLRSAQRADGEQNKIPLGDSAPEFGGSVVRTKDGRQISVPVVTQLVPGSAPELGQDLHRVNTQGQLTNPTPIERLGQEAAKGFQDPKTLRAARRQLGAKGLLPIKSAKPKR